jgi:hypothetical protein
MFLHLGWVLTASAEDRDCQLSTQDYYDRRRELRGLRRGEGESIGVAAEGEQCERALDDVIRNGPFLGVHRVEPGATDQCTAVLRPGSYDRGYTLTQVGDCRSDASGPSRMVTPWLPFAGAGDDGQGVGVSGRWNEDLGRGFSGLVDVAFGTPSLGDEPIDGTPIVVTDAPLLRALGGVDLAREGLRGGYFGVRGGAVMGHKWVGNGLSAQIGGGLTTEIPIGLGPSPAWTSPVLEARVGLANRR